MEMKQYTNQLYRLREVLFCRQMQLAVMYHQSIDYGNKKPSTQEALSSKATIKEEALSFQGASQLLSKIQKERQRTVREGVGFSKALEMFTSIEKYFKSINNSRN